ncbi:MAG: S41 family peptidase [Planctomycetes bacterium]|nr:S41 family peptidase [Planctomycetota bacterium]
MRLRDAASGVFACLTLLAAAVADDKLAGAYKSILQGDYQGGLAAVERVRENAPTETVTRLEKWLGSFQDVRTAREDLRANTFDWNVEQARKTLGEAEQIASGKPEPALSAADRELAAAKKLYLGLNFATQASNYADGKAGREAFAREAWVRDLRDKVIATASWWGKNKKWSKATAYYALLERIDPKDEEIKNLREAAGRHARLEYIYRTEPEVERRLASIEPIMFERAMSVVNDLYFKEPDFHKMALGAIDNMVALCNTTKLYDVGKAFNGIAAQPMRDAFLNRLAELRAKVEADKTYRQQDIVKLYRAVRRASEESVSLPEALLVSEFTEGALGELDQFTSMIWPADAVDFDKQMMGHFFGVGIQLGVDEASGRLKCVTPLEDSPALEAGIQPDDLIMSVNGESTKGWTTDEAIRKITGEEGTAVTLTMQRPVTGESIDFPLTRRNIRIKTVRGVNRIEGDREGHWNYMLDGGSGVAYIKLSNFTADSGAELDDALEHASAQGMKGLILDLRYNPGGLLDVAVETVSEFVRKGNVVSTKGRQEERQKLDVSGKAAFADMPLIVLVNESSASASEILSGALQDHQRAVILGERTFGKGSVQKVINLDRQSLFGGTPKNIARLKVTTALYYLPNGRSPHKLPDAEIWGVDPSLEIELMPKEITKVFERDRRSYVIHNEKQNGAAAPEHAADKPKEPTSSVAADDAEDNDNEAEDLLSKADLEYLRSDPFKAPDVDPQVETALLQLRVKLASDQPWPREFAKSTTVSKDDKP